MHKFQTQQEKAGYTNRARNAFRTTYGERTYNVISRLIQGWNTEEIGDLLGESRASIAAFQANLTRGTYNLVYHRNGDPFDILDCNW